MDAVMQTLAELLGRDAALVRGQVGGRVAVWQVGTERGHEEELAHNEDERDGTHAEQVLNGGFVADHHVAGDGVEQHFQAAAGAVLGQHLDELDADDDVQRTFQKCADLCIVAVEQQAGHPFQQRHDAEQQADEDQPGERDLQQGGCLDDVVAQRGAAVAFHRVVVGFEHGSFSFASSRLAADLAETARLFFIVAKNGNEVKRMEHASKNYWAAT